MVLAGRSEVEREISSFGIILMVILDNAVDQPDTSVFNEILYFKKITQKYFGFESFVLQIGLIYFTDFQKNPRFFSIHKDFEETCFCLKSLCLIHTVLIYC